MFNELCMHALRRRRLLRNIHSHKRRRGLEATFCITTLSEITGLNLTPSVTTAAAMPFILFSVIDSAFDPTWDGTKLVLVLALSNCH